MKTQFIGHLHVLEDTDGQHCFALVGAGETGVICNQYPSQVRNGFFFRLITLKYLMVFMCIQRLVGWLQQKDYGPWSLSRLIRRGRRSLQGGGASGTLFFILSILLFFFPPSSFFHKKKIFSPHHPSTFLRPSIIHPASSVIRHLLIAIVLAKSLHSKIYLMRHFHATFSVL